MHDMSVLWLRVAAVLYSVGLLHALFTVVQQKRNTFRVALGAFYVGLTLHMVSLVETGVALDHFPANTFYESISLCGFLLGVLFLIAYFKYDLQSLSIFVFPLVFLLTFIAALERPVGRWSSPSLRDAWLLLHVFLVLAGYAALFITGATSALYLIRERQLKTKKARVYFDRLPPLGTLDALIFKAMAVGFIFITLSVIAGSVWAFIESGTSWIKDPRIAISLFTWGFYLVIVTLRVAAGWRGRKAAMLMVGLLGCSALTWAAHTGLRPLLTR